MSTLMRHRFGECKVSCPKKSTTRKLWHNVSEIKEGISNRFQETKKKTMKERKGAYQL